MPKLGLTMTEGVVARWDVAPGSRFAAGDIILVVETDKIAYDIEAPAPGILEEVLVSAGSAVPVGTPIGRWDVGDIKVSLDAPSAEAAAEPRVAPSDAGTPLALPATPARSEGERIRRRHLRDAWHGKPVSICARSTAPVRGAGSRPQT